jgi:hypothetical protein
MAEKHFPQQDKAVRSKQELIREGLFVFNAYYAMVCPSSSTVEGLWLRTSSVNFSTDAHLRPSMNTSIPFCLRTNALKVERLKMFE